MIHRADARIRAPGAGAGRLDSRPDGPAL